MISQPPIRSQPPAASFAPVDGAQGNDDRLVAQINYQAGTLEIRFFGTHEEYDNIDVETV